ncbi:60S ribosomal protein L7a [Tupaia chinensis]|uniref:60S ribosomal protein L7a n=1 Tax=Tupaia chinensis TaxID=246437 RepID=L9KPL8_TUPCH|nr:60S ribosomal protein L7a [Tupaia chinensis]
MALIHLAAAAEGHPLQVAESASCNDPAHPDPGHQTATELLKLAHKYRPETKQEKQLLLARAEKKAAGKGDVPTKRPPVLQAGVNIVTTWVENKKAQLVVIIHDMDPPSWLSSCLPCVGRRGSHCIIKGKAKSGHLVYRKTHTTVTFTQIHLCIGEANRHPSLTRLFLSEAKAAILHHMNLPPT